MDWDYGFDFYAPQTFETRDGRRILFGWAGMADADAEYTVPTAAEGWQHMLTVPREVTLHEGRLRQYPVKELDAMRLQQLPCKAGETAVVPDTVFDLDGGMKGPFELRLNESCVLSFDGKLVSLRFEDELGSGRQCRRAEASDVRNVRVLADTSILEIYVGTNRRDRLYLPLVPEGSAAHGAAARVGGGPVCRQLQKEQLDSSREKVIRKPGLFCATGGTALILVYRKISVFSTGQTRFTGKTCSVANTDGENRCRSSAFWGAFSLETRLIERKRRIVLMDARTHAPQPL